MSFPAELRMGGACGFTVNCNVRRGWGGIARSARLKEAADEAKLAFTLHTHAVAGGTPEVIVTRAPAPPLLSGSLRVRLVFKDSL